MRASRSRSEGIWLDGKSLRELPRKELWGYHLGTRLGEKIVDEGCNFRGEMSNMQTKDRFDADCAANDAAIRLVCTC